MANRILHAEMIARSTVPAEAEVHLTILTEVGDGSEVRARLMGPRCLHASTVEVAYHFRPVLRPATRPAVTMRAIIPEASLWSPQTPHLYVGAAELWHREQRLDSWPLRIGLRDFRAGPRGLRCNGHLVSLRGVEASSLDDDTALRLRGDGVSLLLCPTTEATRGVWEVASRVGFAVVGRVAAETPAELPRELAREASALGWLLAGDAPALTPPHGTLLGTTPDHPAMAAAHFVAAASGVPLPAGKPVLLLGGGETTNPVIGRMA